MCKTKDILRYIEGDLSDKKVQELDSWLNLSKGNMEEYIQTKNIYDLVSEVKDIKLFDVEEEWDQFENMLKEKPTKVVSFKSKFYKVIGIAASVLIFGILAFYFTNKEPLYKNLVTQNNIDSIQLVDGSKIYLDRNSKLKYFTRIEDKAKKRYVELDGSAKFDIAHNDKLPFVVFSNNAGIDVLGTVFEIEKTTDGLIVENFEGVVKLFEWKNASNSLILNKGEKARFSRNGIHKIEKPIVVQDTIDMKGQFYTVGDVIETIFDKFDSRITTAPYTSGIVLSDRVFVDLEQSLDDIMLQLDKTAELKYRKTCHNCYEIYVLKAK